ncbi:uncharacterized protein LOC112590384 [Harpegnathos saltator]|uniref:uncharacterized protein LOC112590384 n=1 Tax=Harpegnathos saltator TaxID=610380 RepID=UPI000DBEF01E|nr:uncharacterized protein LOC112590384 [Harpegnathos saltator]
MWEKPRMDGKRKLKYNAVPTIFNNIPACNVDTHVANARASPKIDNECDAVYNSTSSDLPMQVSNSSEDNPITCVTPADQSFEDVSVPPATYTKTKEATSKLEQANIIINRLEKSRQLLKRHVRRLTDEKKKLAQDNLKTKLKRINGYKALLAQQHPLPSERTLRRKKEGVNFEEGILEDVFDILKKQISLFKDDREKDAMIAIDEMRQIQKASHALVIMLAGIFSRWKQVVAYYYTPNRFNGANLKPIVETVIRKAEFIGIYVHSITSDMGSVNQAMWKAFDISSGKLSVIKNSIPHPIDNQRNLYFFADAPHLLKKF